MQRAWRTRILQSAAVCLFGSAGLILLASGCFYLGCDLATGGFTLLTLMAVLSLVGRFFDSAILSVVAIGTLNYFFIPPIFSLQVANREDAVAMAAFFTTSIIITGLSARVRKLAAEELRQTRADLARFARVAVLGELTASIAHEVNQPLAGVVTSGNACLRWLASRPPNIEKAMQSANRIIRDANRASEVVHRVRSLVTNAPPQKSWCNINEAIQEIVVLSRREVEQNRISLTTQLAVDLPPVWVDRIQLQQVFMNLIVNAVEAMKSVNSGPRDLSVTTERDKSRGVLATVRDSGPGLDSEKLQDIFNTFYTTKTDGIGMGLAISRSIIESHGGRLWATPNSPRGAVFQLNLPAVEGDQA